MGTTLRKLCCGLHQMHVFALKGAKSCHPPPVADPVAWTGSPIRATPPPGPIRTRILVKYVDFGLAEIADPGSPTPQAKIHVFYKDLGPDRPLHPSPGADPGQNPRKNKKIWAWPGSPFRHLRSKVVGAQRGSVIN